MNLEELNKSTGLEFKDISNESYRAYNFSDGKTLQVNDPQFIHVSESGGHRIATKNGVGYYIQPRERWYIIWENIDKDKPFVF